jgi:type VI protein secretion system component VasK
VARNSVELRWPGQAPGVTLSFQGAPKAPPAVRSWSGDFAFLQMLQDAQKSAASASGVTFQVGTGAYAATFRLRLTDTTADPFLLPELKTFACPGKL